MTQKLILTWDDLQRDVQALAGELSSQQDWNGIVAIARGGLVPASLLAYELNIRTVETISLASYGEDHQQTELKLLKGPNDALGDGTGWLIIDDLVDTGETTRLVRELLPQAYMAVVYAKPLGKPVVDKFVKEVSQDTWIVFPWEES